MKASFLKKKKRRRKRAKGFRTKIQVNSWHTQALEALSLAYVFDLTSHPVTLGSSQRMVVECKKGKSPCSVGFARTWWQPQRRVDPSDWAGVTRVSQHDGDHSYT